MTSVGVYGELIEGGRKEWEKASYMAGNFLVINSGWVYRHTLEEWQNILG
jgi:hypothetical protein